MFLALVVGCIPATLDLPTRDVRDPSRIVPDRKGVHAGDDAVEQVDGGEIETETVFGDTGLADAGGGGEDGKMFWQLDEVREVDITLPQESYSALQQSPTTYVSGEVVIEGEDIGEIGVRLKGESTYRPLSGKAGFKLKFDFTDDDKQVDGLRRLTLHSNVYDPSFLHELTSHHVWQAAGLAAKRVGYAWVTVNGLDYGLYTVVDTADESFLKAFYDDPSGALWEAEGADFYTGRCSGFELKEPPVDIEASASIFEACGVGELQGDDFYDQLDATFGQAGFFEYVAIEAAVAHWDGYGLNLNNWFVYYEPESASWSMAPHSTDLAWGWNPWDYGNATCFNYQTDPRSYDNGRLLERCNAHPECKERLYETYEWAADLIEDETDAILDLIDDGYALIAEYVPNDPRMEYSVQDFEQHVDCLQEKIPQRPDVIRARVGL